jgi:predicted RNase H-like HicB family nuclease
MAARMKSYTVVYERDETNWWVAKVRGVAGVHTQGRSIDEARRRVREALSLAIGDEQAESAKLVDDVRLPGDFKRLVSALKKAREREEKASAEARTVALRMAKASKGLKLSSRDTAELTGFSFQRIHQLTRAKG